MTSYNELPQTGRVLKVNTGHLVQTHRVITVVYIIINVLSSQFAHLQGRRMQRMRAGRSRMSILPSQSAVGRAAGRIGCAARGLTRSEEGPPVS